MWDELKLQNHVDYCTKKDKVIGFEEWGINRTDRIADHGQTIMMKELYSEWKIPIAYGFCQAATPYQQLIEVISDVILLAKEVGLETVASVCDQGSNNQAASIA